MVTSHATLRRLVRGKASSEPRRHLCYRCAAQIDAGPRNRVNTWQQGSGNSMTRRRLLSMIGLSAGGAAMYQAMNSLGFAARIELQGADRICGAPRRLGAGLGAGIAGMVAAYELRKAGYRVQVLEYNVARRRAQLDLARRRALYRTRRRCSGVQVRSRPLHQSRPVADSLPSSRHAELLQDARSAARNLRADQLQRLLAQQPRLRRQAAALPRR